MDSPIIELKIIEGLDLCGVSGVSEKSVPTVKVKKTQFEVFVRKTYGHGYFVNSSLEIDGDWSNVLHYGKPCKKRVKTFVQFNYRGENTYPFGTDYFFIQGAFENKDESRTHLVSTERVSVKELFPDIDRDRTY